MSSQVSFVECIDSEDLVPKLAARIRDLLSDGINKRGQASLAVSGGQTPVPLFRFLSQMELAWDKVVITLVDERWVDVSSKDSNEHLVRTCLLQNKAAEALFVGMKTSALSAEEGEKECAERLQSVPMPFDVLILGMGGDGHTASLFPGTGMLADAVDMHSGKKCIAVVPGTAPHERMTLTLPAILNSKEIILHIAGQEKKQVYIRAVAEGKPEDMPIRFVLKQVEVPVNIYWCP